MPELLRALEGSGEYAPPEIAVALLAVHSGGRLPTRVFETYEGSAFSVHHRQKTDFLTIHRMLRRIRGTAGGRREVAGCIATLQFGGSNLILTTRDDMEAGESFTDFRDHCLIEWVGRFYPDMDAIRIGSRNLVAFLVSLDQGPDSLQLLRSTIRFPASGFQQTERAESLNTVLERLDDEGGFLDRVTLRTGQGRTGYTASLARDGLAMHHSGDLERFLRDYVNLLAVAGSSRDPVLEALGNASGAYPPALEVQFAPPFSLSDAHAALELVEAFEQDEMYAVTVLHGNPYLHITVTDLAHGSTFTVFSHGPGGLRIYPGAGTDRPSLDHLVSWISQHFVEVSSLSLQPVELAHRG